MAYLDRYFVKELVETKNGGKTPTNLNLDKAVKMSSI